MTDDAPGRLKTASKFDWLTALFADPGITDSAKVISAAVALKNVKPGGMTFRVRQSTIADKCATSERQVQRAFKALRNAGWIHLVEERRRGRGNHGADQYRLTIPEIPDRLSPITAEIPDSPGANTRQSRQKYPTATAEIPDKADSVTSENYDPKGISKGFSKGFERGFGAHDADADSLSLVIPDENIIDAELVDEPDDPEPPQFCSKHPYGTKRDGTAPACGPCGTHREARKAWTERNWNRMQLLALNRDPGPTEAEKRRAAIDNCDRCDINGDYEFINFKGRVMRERCAHQTADADIRETAS